MYILTDNENRILAISKTLSYQNDGYPVVYNDTLAIASTLVSHTYEKDEEIDNKYNSHKYCYTEEKGFYIDPNWRPYYPTEERVAALEDAVNSLLIGGLE